MSPFSFAKEGGSFIAIKSWIEGGHANLPPRKFVGLTSEMDDVVAKYRAAGNDWKVLNRELNLGSNDLSRDTIYIVKIKPNDPRFRYEMPNGQERGAYPNEWVPGGHTKSGTKEAALIGSESITHNSNLDTLLSNFTDIEKTQ